MDRRSFLAISAALAALGLSGCGSDTADSAVGSAASGEAVGRGAQEVQGRIAPELVFPDAQVGSAFGTSTVSSESFTTSISSNTVGLLSLGDSAGKVRAFALTLPGESPVFSAENTGVAVVFMEPGQLKLNPTEARKQMAAIRASSAFAPFAQLLLSNASTPLETLAQQPNYASALDALLSSLGNPFTSAPPRAGLVEGGVRLTNPSPRFLGVRRMDVQETRVLEDFLSDYGTLVDRGDGKTLPTGYRFEGLGLSTTLPEDTSLVESTYLPTLFFNSCVPLLELAAGQPLSLETGLRIMGRIPAPAFEPRADLASETSLSAALTADVNAVNQSLIDAFQADIESVIVARGDRAGLLFTLAGVLAYMKANYDPQPVRIGSPYGMIFIATALLFLPSLFDVAAITAFG